MTQDQIDQIDVIKENIKERLEKYKKSENKDKNDCIQKELLLLTKNANTDKMKELVKINIIFRMSLDIVDCFIVRNKNIDSVLEKFLAYV